MIVEHVDEPGKAPRGVALVRREAGDARDDDDGEATRDLEIIELRARIVAQRGEVEAHQAVAAGDASGDRGEGILLALERLELLVHAAHEGVKMHPRLAPQRRRGVESVHQEAFSPPYAAPQVHAARRHGRTEPAEKRLTRLLESDELVVQALQARERLGLCAVEDDVAADELGLEMPDERAT